MLPSRSTNSGGGFDSTDGEAFAVGVADCVFSMSSIKDFGCKLVSGHCSMSSSKMGIAAEGDLGAGEVAAFVVAVERKRELSGLALLLEGDAWLELEREGRPSESVGVFAGAPARKGDFSRARYGVVAVVLGAFVLAVA